MTPPDPKLVEAIYSQFGAFCLRRGEVSEADTRANILDRLFHEVLGWPREFVQREDYVHPGYVDYLFKTTAPVMIVEAKAADTSFVLPLRPGMAAVRLRIDGTLKTNRKLQEALLQVQRYCIDSGARYGVATNGYTFVVFRAVVERESWRRAEAVVFQSPKTILKDFTTFWKLLSYDAVRDGMLDEEFRRAAPQSRDYHRPIDQIVNADATYGRNPINTALRPYAERFFGDISRQAEIGILEHCYVHSKPLQQIDDDLTLTIEDRIPHFAEAAKQLSTNVVLQGGPFDEDLRQAVVQGPTTGTVVLVMGGIGAGKTTFLRRFFSIVVRDLVAPGGPAVFAALDFLGAPAATTALDEFLWNTLKDALVARDARLLQRETLEMIAEPGLEVVQETYRGDSRLQERINDRLFTLVSSAREFSEAVLRHERRLGRVPIVVFDNVDQLSVEAQSHIFTSAEFFAHHLCCMSVLVMREESYCTAQLRKQLTAYTIRPYHLSSPRFRDMARVRIDFAAREASEKDQLKAAEDWEFKETLEFFQVLRRSLFDRNRNIVRLIEAISYGNMRLALDLFNSFILSGATNTPEILERFRQNRGGYIIPFHQFCKSVMLGDYRYYKETRSHIGNLFFITQARNASHFTSLRILNLCAGAFLPSKDSEGFCDLQEVLNAVVDCFDNEQDCVETIRRVMGLGRQLVELDTRRTDALEGARAVRITSAGRYYLQYLANAFAYLDLVWQDTAIGDRSVADRLARIIGSTEMDDRFVRVETFLKYLDGQESAELVSVGPGGEGVHFFGPFVPRIRQHYLEEKKFVMTRTVRRNGSGV